MHKLVTLLLIALYLPAALNATVTAHYCMGEFTGADITASVAASNKCSKCSMIKKEQKGCCHDKQETLRLSKDQLSSPTLVIATPFTAILPNHYSSIRNVYTAFCVYELPTAHSPPLLTISTLLLYCVFRI